MLNESPEGLPAEYMMGVEVGEYFVVTEVPGWEEEESSSRNAGLREDSSRAIITDDIPPLFLCCKGGVEQPGTRDCGSSAVCEKKKSAFTAVVEDA